MKLFIALFFVSCTCLKAQTLNWEDIRGEWICKEAVPSGEKIPAQELKGIEILKKAFINSRFVFKSDSIFNLQFPKESHTMLNDLKFLNGKKWYFYPQAQMVSIGPYKENIMQIYFKKEKDTTFFFIYEMPLALRMEKL